MTLFGWIMFSLFSLLMFFFLSHLIKDILWNRRLSAFKKELGEKTPKVSSLFWVKRSYGSVVAGLFVLTILFSGTFKIPNMLDDRVLVNAKALSGEEELKSLITNRYGHFNELFRQDDLVVDGVPNNTDPNASETPKRDFIGTNNQVNGVDEADIIKTDGHTIYYASRYQNSIRILSVGDAGIVSVENVLDLGNLYTDSIYLTGQYLIVIGYLYETDPYYYQEDTDSVMWRYTSYSGSVTIFDRATLEIAYQLTMDSNFYQYRLIGSALFLVSSKSLNDDTDLRPHFTANEKEKDEVTTHLDYADIYYFDNVPAYSMSIFTGINLDTFEMNSQAFLGHVNQIYADENNIYTSFSYFDYYNFTDAFAVNTSKTQILKFYVDTEKATFKYIAQGVIDGIVESQYWMDEYNNYLRVVTTEQSIIKNRLYVLKEDKNTDNLDIIGSITEGLGKPNERVYSVDFKGDIGYVITFQTIDPRYWIDLSNPSNPRILKATEREGVPTFLYIWNNSGSQVIGLGYTTDINGRQTGIELSAYDEENNLEDAYQLLNQDDSENWVYNYSEALYNPKAIMISSEKGIVAFPVSSYITTQNEGYNFHRSYVSQYLVFMIDFSAEDESNIISEPIIISHPESSYYFEVERGLYIEEMGDLGFEIIYTLSNLGMISYNLTTNEVYQTLYY